MVVRNALRLLSIKKLESRIEERFDRKGCRVLTSPPLFLLSSSTPIWVGLPAFISILSRSLSVSLSPAKTSQSFFFFFFSEGSFYEFSEYDCSPLMPSTYPAISHRCCRSRRNQTNDSPKTASTLHKMQVPARSRQAGTSGASVDKQLNDLRYSTQFSLRTFKRLGAVQPR